MGWKRIYKNGNIELEIKDGKGHKKEFDCYDNELEFEG